MVAGEVPIKTEIGEYPAPRRCFTSDPHDDDRRRQVGRLAGAKLAVKPLPLRPPLPGRGALARPSAARFSATTEPLMPMNTNSELFIKCLSSPDPAFARAMSKVALEYSAALAGLGTCMDG